jgi:hypothetical protein
MFSWTVGIAIWFSSDSFASSSGHFDRGLDVGARAP